MIKVSLLSGHEVVLNAELIEAIEATPDTIITLTSGKKIMVKDAVNTVVERVIHYRKAIRGFTIWQRQKVWEPGISRMIGEMEELRDLSEEIGAPSDEEGEITGEGEGVPVPSDEENEEEEGEDDKGEE